MAYIALPARDSSLLLLANAAPRLPRSSCNLVSPSCSLKDASLMRPLKVHASSLFGARTSSKFSPKGHRNFASVEGSVSVEEPAVNLTAEESTDVSVPATTAAEGTESSDAPVKRLQRSNSRGGKAGKAITVTNEQIVPGAVFTGQVRSVQSYGAFVDIGAFTDGLVHISELASKFVKEVGEVVTVGQEVTVTVLELNEKAGRIALSMRDRESEAEQQSSRSGGESSEGSGSQGDDSGKPMNRGKIAGRGSGAGRSNTRSNEAKTKLKKGEEVKGTVKNIIRNGAFIEFAELGEEAFLRGSEVTEGGENVPMENLLTVGQEVTVRILKIERGKAYLTMKPQVDMTSINKSINTGVTGGASNPFATFFRSVNMSPETPAALDAQEKTPEVEETPAVAETSSVQDALATEESAAVQETSAVQEISVAEDKPVVEEKSENVETVSEASQSGAPAAVESNNVPSVVIEAKTEEPHSLSLGELAEGLGNAVHEVEKVVEAAAGGIDNAVHEVENAAEAAADFLNIGDKVEEATEAAPEGVKAAVADVKEVVADKVEQAKEDAPEDFKAAVAESKEAVENKVEEVKGAAPEEVKAAVGDVKEVVPDKVEQAKEAAPEDFKAAVAESKEAVEDKVEEVKEAAPEEVKAAVGDVKEVVSDKVEQAKEAAPEDFKAAVAESKEAVEDKVEEVKEAAPEEVKGAAPEEVKAAVSEAKEITPEASKVGAPEESKAAAASSGPTAAQVKELREKSGAGMMECKKALVACNNDITKASEYLRKKGLASAEKKSGRIAAEGRVGSYVHDGRMGVLMEINCETDFVSRGTQFKELVADMGMQVVACPDVKYVSVDDVPADFVAKEKEIEMGKEDLANKPPQIREKIVEGRIAKRLAELALLEQAYIRDDKVPVKDLVKEITAKLGEKVQIRRFVRFNLGEGIQKKSVDFAAEVAAQTAAKVDEKPATEAPKAEEPKKDEGPKVQVSAAKVKELRDSSGAGMMDCKKALAACDNDLEKASDYLRKKGLASADKKSGRIASEGLIGSYIHDGRIGVLIEVNSETDFVARSAQFKELVANMGMQVAACPQVEYVSVDEIPSSFVEKEKEIEATKEDLAKKPEAVRSKIVEGRVAKTLNELALLEQPFIRDDKILVKDYIKQIIATLGENIQVRRFARFNLGEGIEKRSTDFAAEVAAQTGKA